MLAQIASIATVETAKYIGKHVAKATLGLAMATAGSIATEQAKNLVVPMVKGMIQKQESLYLALLLFLFAKIAVPLMKIT